MTAPVPSTRKPGVMPQPPIDVWYRHLDDGCLRCRNNPLDLCPVGAELLKKAVEA